MATSANKTEKKIDMLLDADKVSFSGIALLVLIACGVSVGSWVWIEYITGVEAWDHRYYWIFNYPLLVATSFVTAYIDARKPWLWGLIPVLSQAVYIFVGVSTKAVLLSLTFALFAILSIPCVLAAYFGIRFRQRRLKK